MNPSAPSFLFKSCSAGTRRVCLMLLLLAGLGVVRGHAATQVPGDGNKEKVIAQVEQLVRDQDSVTEYGTGLPEGEVELIIRIMGNFTLQVLDIDGDHPELVGYVSKALKDQEINPDPALAKKAYRIKVEFRKENTNLRRTVS